MKKQDIIIITGFSGSGKSTAIEAFEDAGFFCVDNLPVALLPKFLELPIESGSEIRGLAFVMDVREKRFLSSWTAVFDALRQKGFHFQILFLEADENTLLRRYSQTRRQHPLASSTKSLIEGIREEREQLKSLRAAADRIIDTSYYNVHNLKSLIRDIAHKRRGGAAMKINVISFGFKYGVPLDADIMIDVRFLANPYFVPALKPLDGENSEIRDYVLNRQETQSFLKKYFDLIDELIPLYEREGKAYLTIAVGCTGGMHRSVAITRELFEHIRKTGRLTDIIHRDMEQERASAAN